MPGTNSDVSNRSRRTAGAVVLFSAWRTAAELRSIASRLGLDYFTLPIHWLEFRRLLRRAMRDGEDA